METINKLLIASIMLAFVTIAVVVFLFLHNDKSTITDRVMNNDRSIVIMHPYNECLKLFVEKAKDNKDAKEFEFEHVKAICFELLNKDKNK